MAREMQVTFEGMTGREPELGQTHAGKSVMGLSVAVTPSVKDGDGWKDRATSWVEVRLFGELAENAAASLPKGTAVLVSGRLYEDVFTRRDGSEGRKLVCEADYVGPSLRFATAQVAKRERGSSAQKQQAKQGQSWGEQSRAESWAGAPVQGEEVPF